MCVLSHGSHYRAPGLEDNEAKLVLLWNTAGLSIELPILARTIQIIPDSLIIRKVLPKFGGLRIVKN